ncbi:MAG TPA: bifunctional DNA-formamidopyrimidine glycosylase/DNA-(apurinic or apyrimidinic site) lyase [bacterium]|nr:bifunctional DNA-formamidopyrimidine glycosylase/DNA-(apurinic or apyrimidinic site) lyase [bacterium]
MPELPEVETIRRGLEKRILEKKVNRVEINTDRMVKKPSPKRFKEEVEGRNFKQVIRRGKYLILVLSSGKEIVIHLRMTGQLIYGKRDTKNRVSFLLSNGKYLNLNDSRHLGEIRLVENWKRVPSIAKMGMEPLEGSFTLKVFGEMLNKRKAKIKPLLMNQEFLAGVGNIYAQEALFKARIHPERHAHRLKRDEVELLFSEIKKVLKKAIDYKGSSLSSYVDVEGKRGSFHSRLRVYGRGGEPCVKCKTPLEFVRLAGRGTTFCPKCQK